MSTDQTPALARATEAMDPFASPSTHNRADMLRECARATVSAALTDDADPDWLARVHDEHRRISPAHMDTSRCSCGERFATQWRWCQHVARAVRAAILGADQ